MVAAEVASAPTAEELAEQQRALSSVKEVLVESIPMPEAQSAYLTAVAEAGTYASEEISLAATASHFTAAEVASVPTAEQLAEVAAEPLSIEGVEVESTSMPEAQSVDGTATVKEVSVESIPMPEGQSAI